MLLFLNTLYISTISKFCYPLILNNTLIYKLNITTSIMKQMIIIYYNSYDMKLGAGEYSSFIVY